MRSYFHPRGRGIVCRLAFIAIAIALLTPGVPMQAVSPNIVISQVYGGGGNSGATYKNDFIELYNRGTGAVDLSGWSVQYASASGTTWQVTALSGTLDPGKYFLIQEAQGAGGTLPLPTPSVIGVIAMSATTGKVALVSTATALSGGCPLASTVDFVGFGTANCFEGAGPTPAPSNSTAVLRGAGGATDTDNNSIDFAAGAPTPRTSSTALAAVGSAGPAAVNSGETSLLSVIVTPGLSPTSTGITVKANLSTIGGAANQSFSSSDNITFTFAATVTGSAGTYLLPVSVADAQGRTASATISVIVNPPPADVVISQVYGGGGNSGAILKSDFVELFNRSTTPVNLSGWSVQYASSSGTSWAVTQLTGTIQPGGWFLVKEATGAGGIQDLPAPDAAGTIAMAAGSGKVALVNTIVALGGSCPHAIDFVGYGSANCSETAPTPALTNTTAAVRLGEGATDTNNNAEDFVVGNPVPRNTTGLPPSVTGAAAPPLLLSGDTSLFTAVVIGGRSPASTGLSVTADLSALGGTTTTQMFDDGTHGDAVADDSRFSLVVTVTGPDGTRTIPITARDEQGRSAAGTITVSIAPPPINIHAIQGSGTASPLVDQFVATTGIVTAVRSSGFFVENPEADWDVDASTSEGLFVFTSSLPSVQRGDAVLVTGTVKEYIPSADPGSAPMTELGGPVYIVRWSGNPLPPAALLDASFTATTGGFEQLERFEGMRVTADLQVIAPTGGSVTEATASATSNGVFWTVIRGVARPLREPGLDPTETLPDGAPAGVPRFDGNPERIRVVSNAQTGASALDVVSGQVLNGITGVFDYSYRSYTLLPDPGGWTATGNSAAVPVPEPSPNEFTIGSFNMERFYDTTKSPTADDVVLTPDAFERRLSKASLAIRHVMRSPDVIGVEEMEDLTTLQLLAARINDDAIGAGEENPGYTAYLEEGNDIGGIDVGLLVRSRVHVLEVAQVGKDATYTQPDGATAMLNDRPPLVLEAEIVNSIGAPYAVTVIVNHLRSLSGIDAADGRVRAKRNAQAEFLAAYIQQRQAANPAEKVVSVGDYNAFQFNDGWVDVIGTIKGTPTPASDVVLAGDDLVTPDLTNLGDALGADQYSFMFDGNAQTLDHVIVNEPARKRASRMAYARNDADFPESYRNDATRPERVSDHDMPVAYFAFPSAPVVTLNGAATMRVEAYTGTFTDPGATAHDDDGALAVVAGGAVNVSVPGTYELTYTATNGFLTTTIKRIVTVSDTTAPAITGLNVSPTLVWPPNHKMVDVFASYNVSDASQAWTCGIEVTSNEPASGIGDGNTAADWDVVDNHHVRVRAERSGRALGRFYTLALSCADGSGNMARQTATVSVPHSN